MEDLKEKVMLVDESNNKIWLMWKLEVHEKWLLHRTFSLFIFNDKKELLLQQRAMCKYHCWWFYGQYQYVHIKENEKKQ